MAIIGKRYWHPELGWVTYEGLDTAVGMYHVVKLSDGSYTTLDSTTLLFDRQQKPKKPKRVNKWLYGWKLYVNYGQGWEYETFEDTFKGYKENRKLYRENSPYPQKWVQGREPNPEYKQK